MSPGMGRQGQPQPVRFDDDDRMYAPPAPQTTSARGYRVNGDESLADIARQYGVHEDDLRAMNPSLAQQAPTRRLQDGTVVRVPYYDDRYPPLSKQQQSPNRYVAPQYFDTQRDPRDRDGSPGRYHDHDHDGPPYPSAITVPCRKCGKPYSPLRKR